MPLLALNLQTEILKLTDSTRPDFAGFPATHAAAAENWSNAWKAYIVQTLSPPPNPAGAETARLVLASTLATGFAVPGGGIGALINGLVAFMATYALALAPSVAPLPCLPPPLPPPFTPGPASADPVAPAASFAATLDTWTRTATVGGLPWS